MNHCHVLPINKKIFFIFWSLLDDSYSVLYADYESVNCFVPRHIVFEKFDFEEKLYFSDLNKFSEVIIKGIEILFTLKDSVDFPEYKDTYF